jgi:hypothetical protein
VLSRRGGTGPQRREVPAWGMDCAFFPSFFYIIVFGRNTYTSIVAKGHKDLRKLGREEKYSLHTYTSHFKKINNSMFNQIYIKNTHTCDFE